MITVRVVSNTTYESPPLHNVVDNANKLDICRR